jgi:hypothetical protein
MKANELMVGNWVNYKGHNVIWDADDFCEDSALSKSKPIPLTEEWLIKFGFKRNDWTNEGKPIYYGWVFNGVMLEYNNRELLLDGYQDTLNIKHVHQLQNLYFALVGEELEIKK